jgi:hypothetical protein
MTEADVTAMEQRQSTFSANPAHKTDPHTPMDIAGNNNGNGSANEPVDLTGNDDPDTTAHMTDDNNSNGNDNGNGNDNKLSESNGKVADSRRQTRSMTRDQLTN